MQRALQPARSAPAAGLVIRMIIGLMIGLMIGSSLSMSAWAQEGRGAVSFLGPQGETITGIRCGVTDRSPPLEVLQAMRRIGAGSALDAVGVPLPVVIPVAFHVITADDGTGDVADAQLVEQIEVLNASFPQDIIQFELASVDRTANDGWYRVYPGTRTEREMKAELAIDPSSTLNFYTASPIGGLLGWAYFPYDAPESDSIHGVVVLNESLPGGSAFPYNEGDTGTHEVGHYLGLYHTFQNGCLRPGDYLRDTPYEREPASGCPIGLDTCPQSGADPVTNFMDYSDDSCMEEFTRGQLLLMFWAIKNYRPGLL
jgi:hypothetical protein